MTNPFHLHRGYAARQRQVNLALAGACCWLLLSAPPAPADEAAEAPLIETIQSSAPSAEKALACKQLAVVGSAEAVPALAELLNHAELSSWARIALEAIPEPAAGEALVTAMEGLEGRLLIGVVNSVGVRRDRQGIDRLRALMSHADPEVAAAAAIALGSIGGAEVQDALVAAVADARPGVRSAVAEGCILCAEQLAKQGESAAAIRLYQAVRAADVPRIRHLEAMRGEILLDPVRGVPLLLTMLRADDKAVYGMGLSVARELTQTEVTAALLTECEQAAPERQPMLLLALADRQDATILPFVLRTATDSTGPVRRAALETLGQIGDLTCLDPLLKIATEEADELSRLALDALQALPDTAIDTAVLDRFEGAPAERQRVLAELVGRRRIHQATPQLVQSASHSDSRLRQAALYALGEAGGPEILPLLMEHLLEPKLPEEAPTAAQALRAACLRMPDAESCAQQLAAALPRASVSARQTLAEILGAMGGRTALETLAKAAADPNPEVRDTVTRVLGESMSVDAAPMLLELARNAPEERFRVRALRGYLRLARQFDMPTDQRVAMCRQAWEAATRDAERELVLEVLERYPSLDSLTLAVQAASRPNLAMRATQAAQAIAKQLGETSEGVAPLLKQLPAR